MKLKIPKLYRYRRDNELTLLAISCGVLYGSSPTTFNDPYEVSTSYSINEICKILENESYYSCLIDFLDDIVSGLTNSMSSDFVRKYLDTIDKYSNKRPAINLFKHGYENYAGKDFFSDSRFSQCIFHKLISHIKIASFSTDNLSQSMWGYYSESGKGVSLEYNFGDLRGTRKSEHIWSSQGLLIGEIKYSKVKFSTPSIYLDYLFGINRDKYSKLLSNDEFVGTAFHKSSFGEHEHEGRIVAYGDYYDPHSQIYTIKPTAVYLGPKMTSQRVKLYDNLCSSLNIPCYKTFLDFSNSKFTLSCIESNEFLNVVNKTKHLSLDEMTN